MQLPDPAAIRLRDGDDVFLDPDLFALFRQVTEQMGHVAADRGSRRNSPAPGLLDRAIRRAQRAIHDKFVVVDLAELRALGVEFILNIADQLLPGCSPSSPSRPCRRISSTTIAR